MQVVSVCLHYFLVSPNLIWLPWQRPLTKWKIRYSSIICTKSAFLWCKDCEKGPVYRAFTLLSSCTVLLSKYFQLILLSSYVPAGFKCSYMVPIPKIKDCNTKSMSYDDFCGIAISPILSKDFEYCFLDRFGSFLPRDVMLSAVYAVVVCLSVCVCLSHSIIVSKRLNVGSRK